LRQAKRLFLISLARGLENLFVAPGKNATCSEGAPTV